MNNQHRINSSYTLRKFRFTSFFLSIIVLCLCGFNIKAQSSLLGEWSLKCCNDSLAWIMTIEKQDGSSFSGKQTNESSGGVPTAYASNTFMIVNGRISGNTVEFDRTDGSWKQHWRGTLVDDREGMRMINGIWTGDYLDQYQGRNNWHAEKKTGTPVTSGSGSLWNEEEAGGWRGVWTRIGTSDEWDARFTNASGASVGGKLQMTIDRRNVVIVRRNPGTWGLCSYTGTFASDFRSVSGMYQCTDQGGNWSALYPWRATISGS